MKERSGYAHCGVVHSPKPPINPVDARLYRLGLRRIRVGGDGSCQFYALAISCGYHYPQVIRAQIVSYIVTHADLFREDVRHSYPQLSFTNYVFWMGRPNTWGDGITLQAFGLLRQVNVVVVTEKGEEIKLSERPKWPYLYVVREGEHYDGVLRE